MPTALAAQVPTSALCSVTAEGALEQVLELELDKVQRRIINAAGQSHFRFECSRELKASLLREGTDPKYGARHLKRVIERSIVYPLANLVATGQVKTGDRVVIAMKPDGSLTFTKAAARQASAG